MPPIYFSSMFSLPYYYEGPLKDGKPHGQGRQFYVNHIDSGVNFGKPECGSLEYEGGFVDGKWEGQGKWFYASGTLYYEGGFRNGTLHGWGKKFLGYNPGEGYWAQGEGPALPSRRRSLSPPRRLRVRRPRRPRLPTQAWTAVWLS